MAKGSKTPAGDRPRVVIVGAGFGGLAAMRALAKVPVDVTLVDRRNYHTFQPLLYQVATAGLGAESIAYPIRGVLHGHPHFDFRIGTVVSVDHPGRAVVLDDGSRIPYEFLIVAAGAVTASFGIPGVEEHAFPLKTLTDAVRLRAHLLQQFEDAESDQGEVDDGAMNVVVVGGGPTGVELSGGLAELIYGVMKKDHPHLDVSRARIVLLEATDRLLGQFHPRSGASARRTLVGRGVEVRLGAAVESVEQSSVRLKGGEVIRTRTLIWTAGIRPNPLAGALGGVQLSRGGRVALNEDLSVPGRPDVFVIGDIGAVTTGEGPHPQLAPVAMQQGRHVARQIQARIGGRPSAPFRYFDKGTMATIGRNAAVADLPFGIRLRGFPAWVAWLGLHLIYLIGFRNRLTVLLDWAWNYLTYERGARLIVPTYSDDIGAQPRAEASPDPVTHRTPEHARRAAG